MEDGKKTVPGDDPYSRVDYRRFVAWPERILREAPFLTEILEKAPQRSVIDLGCGTGEHSRFLAGQGLQVYSAMTSFTGCAKTSFTPVDGKSPLEGGEGCALEGKGSDGSADRVCSASGE